MKNPKIAFPIDISLVEEQDDGSFIVSGEFFNFGQEFYDKFGKVLRVYLDKELIIQEIELFNGERMVVEWET